MRKSKFIGITSGDYTCTGMMVRDVQPMFCRKKTDEDGKRARTKSPHSQQYSYICEKLTTDGKAVKSLILNAGQIRNVYRGDATIDEYAKRKARKRSRVFDKRLNYGFCD